MLLKFRDTPKVCNNKNSPSIPRRERYGRRQFIKWQRTSVNGEIHGCKLAYKEKLGSGSECHGTVHSSNWIIGLSSCEHTLSEAFGFRGIYCLSSWPNVTSIAFSPATGMRIAF